MGEDFHTAYKDGQWMEGLKRQHRRAMDPEVNPLDGALLPLSPALAYIQQKILPRILRNPFARCFICLPFFFSPLLEFFNTNIRPFLRPVDAVKEGIFPDYYQVSIYWSMHTTSIHHYLARISRKRVFLLLCNKFMLCRIAFFFD